MLLTTTNQTLSFPLCATSHSTGLNGKHNKKKKLPRQMFYLVDHFEPFWWSGSPLFFALRDFMFHTGLDGTQLYSTIVRQILCVQYITKRDLVQH